MRFEREREKDEKKEYIEPSTDETEGDSDKLTPYKTDLEYLDDHFQVIYFNGCLATDKFIQL